MTASFHFDFSTNRDVCVGPGERLSEAQLGQRVLGLRSALPNEATPLLVSCRDRLALFTACLASWAGGHRVVLAASDKPGALERALATSGALALLTDVALRPPGGDAVPALRVDEPRHAPSDARAFGFEVEAERVVVMLFTSGTSGEPQSVDKTARQLFGEAQLLARHFSIGARTVLASTVPAHHLYGLLFSVLMPYFGGARFVVETPFQPAAVAELVGRYAVTDLVTVPAHLRALAPALSGRGELRRVFSSGAVLDPALAHEVAQRGVRVVDVLGSTESGGIATREPATSEVYSPLPGVQVDANADGTLRLHSPFLADAAAPYALADRGRLVPGGFLFDGRKDGVLKIAGNRVSVQELERLARALPNVRDAAVVSVETDSARAREPWLLLASDDPTISLDTVRAALGHHFDAVVLPRRLRVLERLPRNALGKLERSEALAAFRAPCDELSTSFGVPGDWVFFRGHFASEPLLPGVAQLTAVVLPAARAAWPDLGAVTGIRRVKFKRPILPNDRLSVRLRHDRAAHELWFELSLRGESAAVGTLTLAPGPASGG